MPDDTPPGPPPRRFYLHRIFDATGAPGADITAPGVLWPDGTVSIRWAAGPMPATSCWDSLASALHVYGYLGATRIVWLDRALAEPTTPEADRA